MEFGMQANPCSHVPESCVTAAYERPLFLNEMFKNLNGV